MMAASLGGDRTGPFLCVLCQVVEEGDLFVLGLEQLMKKQPGPSPGGPELSISWRQQVSDRSSKRPGPQSLDLSWRRRLDQVAGTETSLHPVRPLGTRYLLGARAGLSRGGS